MQPEPTEAMVEALTVFVEAIEATIPSQGGYPRHEAAQ
jgi:hypothetical protein